MRYLTSIVCSVVAAVAVVAFIAQIAVYGVVPYAQWVVMFFLLVFLGLTWVGDVQTVSHGTAKDLYYRILAEHSTLPAIGFAVQCLLALLYFGGWNLPDNVFSSGLRLLLPDGVFIPLTIEVIFTPVVVVLWIKNTHANQHTEQLHARQAADRAQKQSLQGQVELIKARVDMSDEDVATVLRLIERKAASLPLKPSVNTQIFYQQALQLLISANQRPGQIDLDTLSRIEKAMSAIR